MNVRRMSLTSIGNLSRYFEKVVIPNISVALRHYPGRNWADLELYSGYENKRREL